jgi:hypothetical protein
MRTVASIFVTGMLCAILAEAQPGAASKGEGAIVVPESTTVYMDSIGDEESYTLHAGEPVSPRSGTGRLLLSPIYRFEPVNGRVRINFFPREPELKEKFAMGWVDFEDLSVFYFECCDPKGKACGPVDLKGLTKMVWTSCFREARDTHLAELNATNAPPKTVEVGFTEAEVGDALGEPTKVLKLPTKIIWVYSDIKVTFEDGKVSNLE